MNPTSIITLGTYFVIILGLGILISPWVWLGAAITTIASTIIVLMEFDYESI